MKNKELHSEFTFQIEPKHYFKHNYLTYCNDVLVSMLKYADEEKMASVSIDLGNGENIEFEQDEKWQEWLITHGHREEMYEVYYRHTFEEFAPLNKYTVLMNKLNRTLRSFEMLHLFVKSGIICMSATS